MAQLKEFQRAQSMNSLKKKQASRQSVAHTYSSSEMSDVIPEDSMPVYAKDIDENRKGVKVRADAQLDNSSQTVGHQEAERISDKSKVTIRTDGKHDGKKENSIVSGSSASRESRQRRTNRLNMETRLTKDVNKFSNRLPIMGLITVALMAVGLAMGQDVFNKVQTSIAKFLTVARPRDMSMYVTNIVREYACLSAGTCTMPPFLVTYETSRENIRYYSKTVIKSTMQAILDDDELMVTMTDEPVSIATKKV
jgi:hypothetical protein